MYFKPSVSLPEGTIKFSIQQVMIGVQSSIIMFPVNLLIVTIFRITRPRKKKEVAIIQETKTGSPKQEKKLAEKWRIQTDITIDIVVKVGLLLITLTLNAGLSWLVISILNIQYICLIHFYLI